MNYIQLAITGVIVGFLQWEILSLREKLENFIHPPDAINIISMCQSPQFSNMNSCTIK